MRETYGHEAESPAVARLERLEAAVNREARRLDGKLGVYLTQLADGGTVSLRTDDRFPLASVFKLGVLVELFRRIDAGEFSLEERWTVRPELQSLESGVLMYLDPGLRPTVRDLATLMIIVSDNTATDMLFKRVGLRSVNPTLRRLGLRDTDIYMPNREWYLLCLGYHPRLSRLSPGRLARRWRAMDAEERFEVLGWLQENRRGVRVEAMRARANALERSGAARTPSWRSLEQATDNWASPRDIGTLLASIERRKAASPSSCRAMLDILRNQQYRRLSERIPPGAVVASKTGSIAGVRNDAGILYPEGKEPFVAVCLTRDLTPRQMEAAPAAIERIGRATWDAWA